MTTMVMKLLELEDKSNSLNQSQISNLLNELEVLNNYIDTLKTSRKHMIN